ncbi:MAG TPA: TPM domain-containing protein, partial [Vicinamibacterales bacterium]|nr:TPM domain-containing protein [Vicinamibacterales bacterium]
MKRRTTLLAVAFALLFAAASFAQDVPFLTGRVVDDANILSADARARLTAALEAHERATTNQIVVLTVPTIQPESIEDYAVKVFQTWKLGQKGKDNG